MSNISIVFPHQLYESHPALDLKRPVYVIEEPLFFTQFNFHAQKLIYHRASMKCYAEDLLNKGYTVHYIDYPEASTEELLKRFKEKGIHTLHLCDPTDYLLERRYRRFASSLNLHLQITENAGFLCTRAYGDSFFCGRKKFYLTEFYIEQRKRFDVLMNSGEPEGGKWTYDTENRKKLPAGTHVPALPKIIDNKFVAEARQYINTEFPDAPGSDMPLRYPINRAESLIWMQQFFYERFRLYGDYQDAIVPKENFLFHSILTPMLNIGLLTPEGILDGAIAAAKKNDVPLNATEGFIRQILGWREYIRIVYELRGTTQRTKNFWKFTRKIPAAFYNGTTGIPPVDDAIHRCLDSAYTHHIERLMVLGNFMVLCEIDPDDVYKWFMEMFIDAYDWVMVPNVYGMSQFADGGIMSTKPYISGSNYILKMSNYKKGPWCEIWDALFWRFIHLHKDFFLKNPRMSMMVRQTEKMEPEKLKHHIETAENFLRRISTMSEQ